MHASTISLLKQTLVWAFCLREIRAFSATKQPASAVTIVVERILASTTPREARDAWLSYVFENGGGIPSLVLPLREKNAICQSRLLIPLLVKEDLIREHGTEPQQYSESYVTYEISDLGPFLKADISSGSHIGTVRFSSPGSTEIDDSAVVLMRWEVKFTALRKAKLWEKVTKVIVELASDNLVSYLCTPCRYIRCTYLRGPGDSKCALTPEQAKNAFIRFSMCEGGGLPINPPIVLSNQLNKECVEIVRLPTFLREAIQSVVPYQTSGYEVTYKVMNPGLLTFPVHSHRGRVRFLPVQDRALPAYVEMQWEVEIRPMRGFDGFVNLFVTSVVSTMSRNLKVHLAEPSAFVPLLDSLGNENLSDGPWPQLWTTVSKASWLGGVLAARHADDRSVVEQALAFIHPLSWGRNDDWDEDGEFSYWEKAYML